MSITVSTILTAIQAGLKISNVIEKTIVHDLKREVLPIPLPNFNLSINAQSAMSFYVDATKGKPFMDKSELIQDLVKKTLTNRITSEEEKDFVQMYREHWAVLNPDKIVEHADELTMGLSVSEMSSLLNVRQWNRDDKEDNSLRFFALSMVDVSLDFIADRVSRLPGTSPMNNALKGLFSGLDSIEFAEAEGSDIANALLNSTLYAVGGMSEMLGNSEMQDLLKSVSTSLAKDLNVRIEGLKDEGKKQDILKWGELAFASILKSSGDLFVSNPTKFVDLGSGESVLVKAIGKTMLDRLIKMDENGQFDVEIKALFQGEGLNDITRAALVALNEHPDLINVQHNGIDAILDELISDLSQYPDNYGLKMLPDIAHLVLLNTGGNFDKLWPGKALDKPGNHLLIMASKSVLDTLCEKPADGSVWKPVFKGEDIVELIDNVIQEVVLKPELIGLDGNNNLVKETLNECLAAMKNVSIMELDASKRIEILKIAIRAVALNEKLLDKTQIGSEQQALIRLGIQTTLDRVMDDGKLGANETVELLDTVMNEITGNPELVGINLNNERPLDSGLKTVFDAMSDISIVQLDKSTRLEILKNAVCAIADHEDLLKKLNVDQTQKAAIHIGIKATLGAIVDDGKLGNDEMVKLVDSAVQTIANHPELVGIKDDERILSIALRASLSAMNDVSVTELDKETRLHILQEAIHAVALSEKLIGKVPVANGQQKELIYIAISETLNTIKDDGGFNGENTLDILDAVLEQIASNPEIIIVSGDQRIFQTALRAALTSVNGTSIRDIDEEARTEILNNVFQAIIKNDKLLEKINTGTEDTELIIVGINGAILVVKGESGSAREKWLQGKNQAIKKICNKIVDELEASNEPKEDIEKIKSALETQFAKLDNGEVFSLQEVLDTIEEAA